MCARDDPNKILRLCESLLPTHPFHHFRDIPRDFVQLLKAPFVKTYNIIKSQTGSNDLDGCEVRIFQQTITILCTNTASARAQIKTHTPLNILPPTAASRNVSCKAPCPFSVMIIRSMFWI